MSELRWNPILKEWVITATHRQNRTFKPPKDFCPLCPTREGGFPTEVPAEDYDIVVFQNRFPSLQPDAPEPDIEGSELYPVDLAQGICEVVLFTSEHEGVMSQQPLSKFEKLVKVWKDRYQELGKKDFIDYVYIFENKGEEVGVTLHHPHGQIYAYPFIPPIIERELNSSKEHLEKEGECLFCRVLREEKEDGRRIIASNKSFTAVIPFFARYTYEVHIYANKHLPSMAEFGPEEEKDLARILKLLIMKYDNLFEFVFPYIMCIHQQPTDGSGFDYSHFHIEFYPPYRTKDKLKYLAGSEAGAGTFINGSLAENKAAVLRETSPVSFEDM
ncbi:galactose-1-phosphate uridylyltransferase [Halothermothrix orenii]|uniref:Galactose-1-phosphate uridylyltransferase n=1 Tax=Halothermothrix orenii (strain H 168 / OCM 544 / DSM 9562) TaxID=373903 RepID=B8CZW0_HALOH|nr:galactose-1-phosphate uridylyltransferase [Halothermothrix orenii]ACL70812.1 galactose-1-phosphate uridylyltransferase [Halothermothrix orenii H 168]